MTEKETILGCCGISNTSMKKSFPSPVYLRALKEYIGNEEEMDVPLDDCAVDF
jgi:hypothetical protein